MTEQNKKGLKAAIRKMMISRTMARNTENLEGESNGKKVIAANARIQNASEDDLPYAWGVNIYLKGKGKSYKIAKKVREQVIPKGKRE